MEDESKILKKALNIPTALPYKVAFTCVDDQDGQWCFNTIIIASDPIEAINLAKRIRHMLERDLPATIVELSEVSTVFAT